MKPFFSIIIPVYNVELYLRECLDSVLLQTFGDWEAICVDDGATDDSGAILDGYALKDTRFKVIHQSNAGVSAARNAALDIAKGEWLCFLDSDDKVECHWLEDIADGAKQYPEVDWIRISFRDWFEGKEPKAWPDGHPYKYDEKIYESVLPVAWDMLAYSGMMVMNVFKREKTKGIRFLVGMKYSEDMCFTLDFMIKSIFSHKLLTIPNDDYRYRKRTTSANGNMRVGDVINSFNVIMTKWNVVRGNRGAFTPSIERHFFRCINNGHTMTVQESSDLKSFLCKAWRCGFFSPFYLKGKKKCIRWVLFMIFGKPQFLTDKAGIRWFFPAR